MSAPLKTAPSHPKAKIATRGSVLALWQAKFVGELLLSNGLATELNIIKTTGDKVQDRFLHEIGGKGLFIKELEEALLCGEADLAAHSLKDLPVQVAKEFALPTFLKRHSALDVLVLHPKHEERFADFLKAGKVRPSQLSSRQPSGFFIATGSLRRKALLQKFLPKCRVEGLRGNVDTRIKKLQASSEWDGIILAHAALERLNLPVPYLILDPEEFVPSPSQGVIVLETLASHPLHSWLEELSCEETSRCIAIERGLLKALGGDCTLPIGVHAVVDGEGYFCRATVLDLQGGDARIEGKFSGSTEVVVAELLKRLLDAGVNQILQTLQLPPISQIL